MKTRLLIIISLGIFGFFALSFLLSPSIFGEPYCTDGRFNTDCKSWNNWEWIYYNLSGYRDYPPPLNLSEINLQRILDTCKAKENFVSDKGSNVEIDVIFREYSNNTLYINNVDCFWEDLTTDVSSGNITFNDPVYLIPDGIPIIENEKFESQHVPDYSNLLKGADKNIDIAHHIDMIPINSTKQAFSIKSINLNYDDTITINFGGVNEHFMTIPEFDYTQTFQVNDSFVFYCMPTESNYPSMGVYKYLGTHVIDGNLNYAFYHGDAKSQNEFECIYPEIIEQSVNVFDIEVPLEMLQQYEITLG